LDQCIHHQVHQKHYMRLGQSIILTLVNPILLQQITSRNWPSIVRCNPKAHHEASEQNIHHIQQHQIRIIKIWLQSTMPLRIPEWLLVFNLYHGRNKWHTNQYKCPQLDINSDKANAFRHFTAKAAPSFFNKLHGILLRQLLLHDILKNRLIICIWKIEGERSFIQNDGILLRSTIIL